MPRFNFDKYGHVIRHTRDMGFKAWLRGKMLIIGRQTRAISLHKVGNTLVRRIHLKNGYMIETRITEEEGEE